MGFELLGLGYAPPWAIELSLPGGDDGWVGGEDVEVDGVCGEEAVGGCGLFGP